MGYLGLLRLQPFVNGYFGSDITLILAQAPSKPEAPAPKPCVKAFQILMLYHKQFNSLTVASLLIKQFTTKENSLTVNQFTSLTDLYVVYRGIIEVFCCVLYIQNICLDL